MTAAPEDVPALGTGTEQRLLRPPPAHSLPQPTQEKEKKERGHGQQRGKHRERRAEWRKAQAQKHKAPLPGLGRTKTSCNQRARPAGLLGRVGSDPKPGWPGPQTWPPLGGREQYCTRTQSSSREGAGDSSSEAPGWGRGLGHLLPADSEQSLERIPVSADRQLEAQPTPPVQGGRWAGAGLKGTPECRPPQAPTFLRSSQVTPMVSETHPSGLCVLSQVACKQPSVTF